MERRSKRHAELCDAIKSRYPAMKIQEEVHIGGGLFLDILIPTISIAFEVDGIQHESYHSFFHRSELDFSKQQLNDRRKSLWCKENSLFLYRISHSDKRDIHDIIDEALTQGTEYLASIAGPKEDPRATRKVDDDSNDSKRRRRKSNSSSFRPRH